MLRILGSVLRIPGRTGRAALRHLWLTLLSLVVVLGVLGVGFWQYALHEWHQAQVDAQNDRLDDAQRRLKLCQVVWFRSPEVHLLAARVARLKGDPDAAEAHLNRCLLLQGGANEAVQLEFLLLRVQTGELDEVAPVLFDTVEKGHPDGPIILETLARAYIHRLRYKLAWSCLSRWIDLRPNEARAYQWRGWVLERLTNHKGAMVDYLKALELNPDLVPVRLRVAEMLLEDKQAPEAVPHLERLYSQVPDNPQVQARLGQCRLLQGRSEEARRLLESAVVQLPQDPALLVALANLDLQEGHGVEAENRLRTLLKADPSDTEALYVLASALQLQGRSSESEAVLKDYERKREVVERTNTLLKDVVDSPTAKADDYAEIGRLLLDVGRDKVGTYWMDRALEKDPGNQIAHRALAAYYASKGDTARADYHRRNIRNPEPKAPEPKS